VIKNAIVCEDVWKIYTSKNAAIGEAARAMAALQEGVDTRKVQTELNCHVAVAGVSFSVPPGEIFCIMGLSGSGKSTLLRHLNCLIKPTHGSIVINGEDINKKDESAIRKLRSQTVSMVFQDVALWPHLTVRQNIGYGLEIQGVEKGERDKVADEMLEVVQLSGWGDKYSYELSGGMKQRVGLARALAIQPKILLLDEPFSALDPIIRDELQSQFEQIIRQFKKTVVFITHDLNEAMRLGNRIAIMKDGIFVQCGTAEDIILNPANSYVQNFVRSVPRLSVVRAKSIMKPIKELHGRQKKGALLIRVNQDQNLAELVTIASKNSAFSKLIVTNQKDIDIGFIDLEMLLSNLKT